MKYITTLTMVGLLFLACSSEKKQADVKPSTFENSYEAYAAVLKTYVQEGAVDYAALKESRDDLDSFIDRLAGLSMEEYDRMDGSDQLALWINAYNAIAIRTVIDAYPVTSIRDIDGAIDSKGWKIAGKTLTLRTIRDDILRSHFGDIRMYFALNTASVGSPALFTDPFYGETIDDQLDSAAYAFVNDVDRNTINPHASSITTSELFLTYGDEFEEEYGTGDFAHLEDNERAVLNFIFTYADDSVLEFIDEESEWTLEYMPFDWSLNDANK